MRYLSLFSGIEAASAAWEPLGWRPAAFSEIEPFPCNVLKKRWPEVPNLGDITRITARQWAEYRGIDVLVGGSPCQGFSVAGRMKGLEDERSGLARKYVGAIEEVRPRLFVWENVPGVLSVNGGMDFRSFAAALVRCGYGLAWRVLDSQHFGVPQRRRRVFIVGCALEAGGATAAAKVLLEPEGVQRDPAPRGDEGPEAASAVDGCAGGDRGAVYDMSHADAVIRESAKSPTLQARMGTGGNQVPLVLDDQGGSVMGVSHDRVGTLRAQTHGHAPIVLDDCWAGSFVSASYGVSPTLKARGHAPAVIEPTAGGAAALAKDAPRVYGRGGFAQYRDGGGIAANLMHKGGDIGPGSENIVTEPPSARLRKLTPLECLRLQGFPDDWLDDVPGYSDTAAYKAIGNSMAVPVMRWIGRRMDAVMY